MAKLSVIVPIYNVEEYLEWCLDSLCTQTLTDIEILCVNDGTTDSSRDIAARYAQSDQRIKIIDKENGGLSSARNAGIRAASAPYVCFLDSDDRFSPVACETIVAAFEKSDADIVTFGAHCYPEDAGDDWLIKHLSPRDIEYDGFAPDLLFKEMSRPYAWRTACRRNFLVENDLFFNEQLLFGEDQAFHFAIYPRARKTLLISDKLYDYRVLREGSLMQGVKHDNTRSIVEHLNIVDHIFTDWEHEGFLERYPEEMMSWSVEFALYDIAKQDDPDREKLLASLRALWCRHFSEHEILAMNFPKATKGMIDAVFQGSQKFNGMHGKKIIYAYYVEHYGIQSAIKKATSH